MSCDICGKKPCVANNVSHSGIKKKTRKLPNLHTLRLYVNNVLCKVKACTRCIRTLAKG